MGWTSTRMGGDEGATSAGRAPVVSGHRMGCSLAGNLAWLHTNLPWRKL